jgi:hypothetical protein
MCNAYYELRDRSDGQYDLVAWRDIRDAAVKKSASPFKSMYPIAVVPNLDIGNKLIDRLNSQAVGTTGEQFANGFWPKPHVTLDPCTGEAVDEQAA